MTNDRETDSTEMFCVFHCPSAEAFKIYVVHCAMNEYTCDVCYYKSNKQANVRRLHQRNHKGIVQGAQFTALGRNDQQLVPSAVSGKPNEETD